MAVTPSDKSLIMGLVEAGGSEKGLHSLKNNLILVSVGGLGVVSGALFGILLGLLIK